MTVRDPGRPIVPTPPPDRPDHGYGAEHRRPGALHDWRLKAAVQSLLSRLPHGHQLNHFLQRNVTRTLPISDAEVEGQVAKAWRNVDAYLRLGSRPLADVHFYEFGVGWDLLLPLMYAAFGVGRQTVIDLEPLARTSLVRDVARRLVAASARLGLPRPAPLDETGATVGELVGPLGIEYRAPADARSTGLPDASVDMVTSCDVLEHVPAADIRAILVESHRVLRDDGLHRIRIDYQDHYWYFDERVTPYGFLRFDGAAWRRFNPALHFQNRLRHDELLALVSETGWTVIEDDRHRPSTEDLRTLASMRLAEPFRSMPADRVAIRFANLTLAKAGAREPR